MEISIHPSAIVIVHLLTPFNIIQWSIEEYFDSETYDPTTPRCYGRSSSQRVSAPMSKSFYPILRLILLPLLLLLNFLYLIPPPHPFVFCSVVPSYPLVATSPISAPISVSFCWFLLPPPCFISDHHFHLSDSMYGYLYDVFNSGTEVDAFTCISILFPSFS